MSNPNLYRHQWIWEKNTVTGFANAKIQPLRCFEDVLVFGFQSPNYYPQGLKRVSITMKNRSSTGGESLRGNVEQSKGKGKMRTEGATYQQEYTNYPKQIIQFDTDPDTFHPTQKPVNLIRYLVLTYTNEGDTVLDNCSGSGTTAVACVKEKRHFICFEKDPVYWEKSVKRVENEMQQLSLF